MISWYHACWSQVLDKSAQVDLCIYVCWFEALADEGARWLEEQKLPEAVRLRRPIPASTRPARMAIPTNPSACGGDIQRWAHWLWPYATVARARAHPRGAPQCALIERIQIGHHRAMMRNGFDIPPPLTQVRLIETTPDTHAGAAPATPAARASVLYPVIDEQLQRWWRDPACTLALPCVPARTAFQMRAQTNIRTIAPGTTASYRQVATDIGSAARAVGQACRRNHLPLIVPCHRVTGSHSQGGYLGQNPGARGGYAGALKQALLRREGSDLSDLSE